MLILLCDAFSFGTLKNSTAQFVGGELQVK